MYVLFLLLVPAAFVYYISGLRESNLSGNILAYISGILSGLCALILNRLFYVVFSPATPSFIQKFLMILFSESLIPFVGCIAILFFLFDAPLKQRVSLIRPQLFGISSIVLPFIYLSTYNYPDIWVTLFIPGMLLSLLFLADFFIGRFVDSAGRSIDGLDLFLAFLPIFAVMIFIDLSKTFWFFCYPSWIITGLAMLPVTAAILLRIQKYRVK